MSKFTSHSRLKLIPAAALWDGGSLRAGFQRHGAMPVQKLPVQYRIYTFDIRHNTENRFRTRTAHPKRCAVPAGFVMKNYAQPAAARFSKIFDTAPFRATVVRPRVPSVSPPFIEQTVFLFFPAAQKYLLIAFF
jgi:hypothetical protein